MKKMLLLLCTLALAILSIGTLAAQDIAGTWQGTLPVTATGLRLVMKISKADAGALKVAFFSIDQGGQSIAASTASFAGNTLKVEIVALSALYEGKLSADGTTINGTFTQGGRANALVLTKATKETAWVIPEPPAPQVPMAADADPALEVATIKPGVPGAQGKNYGIQGGSLRLRNFSLVDMLMFAYGVQVKQVIGLPTWAETDKFDVSGKIDKEGRPNDKQIRLMVQKLMTERFALNFNREKRELSVFAMRVDKGGPKLTATAAKPTDPSGAGFRPGMKGGLNYIGRNMTVTEIGDALQEVLLDRPVADQTKIEGRYDISVTFTPDDTMAGGMGARLPPPPEGSEAPPSLFTAMKDTLGLTLEATKAPVDVLVVQHVEKPSEN
jgi:uncharacterized protein (TIGR03435 family)